MSTLRRAHAASVSMWTACISTGLSLLLIACENTPIPASTGTGHALESGSMALVSSDYRSTNLSLRDPSGASLTASLLSTGSRPAGLSFALSGDVVLPSDALALDDELTILDRYGTNVLSFIHPVTGALRAQLPVGTGFEANPQDFIRWNESLAYLSRYGVDPVPGDAEFDGGSDLVVIDPHGPRITGRVAFAPKNGMPARPGTMTRSGPYVVVGLARLSESFDSAGDFELAFVRGDSAVLENIVTLPGLRNCGKPVFSLAGTLAVACTGVFDSRTSSFARAGAGVFVATLTPSAFTVLDRWDADALDLSPAGSVAWLSDDRLAFTTYGHGAIGDAVYTLQRGSAEASRVLTTPKPYTLGSLRCDDSAPVRCVLPMAEPSKLAVLSTTAANAPPSVTVRDAVDVTGLPLRGVAFFLRNPRR